MGELQMDWLRSEDLKEEKNVTAPSHHDSRYRTLVLGVGDKARRNIKTCTDYIDNVSPRVLLIDRQPQMSWFEKSRTRKKKRTTTMAKKTMTTTVTVTRSEEWNNVPGPLLARSGQ
jgi:hypothetical protein